MPLPLPLPTKLKKIGQGKEHKSRNLSNVRTKAYPSRTFISPPISSWFGHFADLPMPTGRSLVWSSPTLWPCLLENEPRWTFAIERIIKSTRALRSHVQQVVLKTQFFSSKIATLTCWDSWDWLAAGHNQFLSTCNVCNHYAILVEPLNTWPWAISCFGFLYGCVTCEYHALCVLCNVLVVSCTCSPLIGITVRQRCFYQPCLIFIGARFVIKVPDNKASNETKTGLRPAWKLNQSYETRQRSRA